MICGAGPPGRRMRNPHVCGRRSRRRGTRVQGDPRANLFFAHMPRTTHARLHAAGARYYVTGNMGGGDPDEMLQARFVTDWSLPEAEIDRFIALLNA